jgi:Ca-activated chloride channel family protein
MRRTLSLAVLSVVALMACGCLQAESRVRVYADVDKPLVLGDRTERVVVRVGLEGLRVPVMAKRVPLNVAVILDKSGSMASDFKMENAKRGAIEIVERLAEEDIFSLVIYDTHARVLVPAQRIEDKEVLIRTISRIHAGGNTALYDGVTLGASQIRRNLCWEYVNRIILLSDGLANVGPQSTEDLAYLGRSLGDEGITVTTIGVGLDYNEDLMTALAARSGGNSYFASSGHELPRIFAEEIGEAMTVVARDIQIRVRCPEGLKPIGLIGRDGDVIGQTMSTSVGELYGENQKFALFEVEVPEGEVGEHLDIAQVSVEYADPFTNERRQDDMNVRVAYGGDEEAVRDEANREVVKEAALARASEAKREAVRLADEGAIGAAADVLKANALSLEKVAQECDNDAEMLEEALKCGTISSDITLNEGFTKYQRKRVVNQIHTQTTQQGFVSDDDDEDKEKKDQ